MKQGFYSYLSFDGKQHFIFSGIYKDGIKVGIWKKTLFNDTLLQTTHFISPKRISKTFYRENKKTQMNVYHVFPDGTLSKNEIYREGYNEYGTIIHNNSFDLKGEPIGELFDGFGYPIITMMIDNKLVSREANNPIFKNVLCMLNQPKGSNLFDLLGDEDEEEWWRK